MSNNSTIEKGAEQSNKLSQEPEVFDGQKSLILRDQAGYDSDTAPSADEWKTMKGYGSFITHDEGDEEHIFHINDIIYVLPTGHDPDEEIDQSDLWLAQIRSIRAHDSDSVWIKAKWFYHPTELPKNVKGMAGKAKRFGSLERLSSNQADFIPTSTCCGLAKIVPFDERDVEQEEIERGMFYYRYDYDWQKRTLRSGSQPCSICKKVYDPDTDIMHFCPRPHCCRSWHTSCLANANWFIKSLEDLPQRLESLDGDWTPLVAAAAEPSKPSPKKKARTEPQMTLQPDDPYARIPQGLLRVARQPIARGGSLGIVGNVRSVVRARKIVQKALKGIEGVPEDWEEKLGNVHDAGAVGPGKVKGKGKAFAYQCPQCGEPI